MNVSLHECVLVRVTRVRECRGGHKSQLQEAFRSRKGKKSRPFGIRIVILEIPPRFVSESRKRQDRAELSVKHFH